MENKNENDNVEIFTDDSVITLYDDENKPIEFFEIASVEHEGKFYEILQPVEPVDGIGEDEAVIFEFATDEKGEKSFRPIFDEAVLESVFGLYISASADYESCGCGGDGCGGDCGKDGEK